MLWKTLWKWWTQKVEQCCYSCGKWFHATGDGRDTTCSLWSNSVCAGSLCQCVCVCVFLRGSEIQTITQSQDQHTAAGKCGNLAHGDDATGRQPLLSGALAARCSRCSLIHSRRLKNKPDWESLLCCRLFAFVWEWVAFFFDWSPSQHQHQQQPKK